MIENRVTLGVAVTELPAGTRDTADPLHEALRLVERMIAGHLREVQFVRLDRKVIDLHFIEPLERFLEDLKKRGTIAGFRLSHDYDTAAYAEGVVDFGLELEPVRSARRFRIHIDAPLSNAAAAS